MTTVEKVIYVDNLDSNIKEVVFIDGTKLVNIEHKEDTNNADNK